MENEEEEPKNNLLVQPNKILHRRRGKTSKKEEKNIQFAFQSYFPLFATMKEKLYLGSDNDIIESLHFFYNFLLLFNKKEGALAIDDLNIRDHFFKLFFESGSGDILKSVIEIFSNLSYYIKIVLPDPNQLPLAGRIIELFSFPDPDTIDDLLVFSTNLAIDNAMFGQCLLEHHVLDNLSDFATLPFQNIDNHIKIEARFVRAILSHGCIEPYFEQAKRYFSSLFIYKNPIMDVAICNLMVTFYRCGIDYEFSPKEFKYFHELSHGPFKSISALLLTLSIDEFKFVRNQILDNIFLENIAVRIIKFKESAIAFPFFHFLCSALDAYEPGPNDLVLIAAFICMTDGEFADRVAALEYLDELIEKTKSLDIARYFLEAGFFSTLKSYFEVYDTDAFVHVINVLENIYHCATIAGADLSQFQCYDNVVETLNEISDVYDPEEGDEKIFNKIVQVAKLYSSNSNK